MILKKIILENIRSYEKQQIDFPLGSILLSGDIGTGKTTILMAIEFALFGLQPSQRGSALLKNGKDEGRIILEFEVDGKQVTIERTIKKSGKTVTQDYSSISIDNEKFEGSVTEIKNRVLQLLSYPSEFAKKTNLLYKFTVYTPQEEMKQIILESADLRLNTLRHVFGIDRYKRVEENLSLFSAKLREEIRNREGQISDIDQIKQTKENKQKNLETLKLSEETENKNLLDIRIRRELIEQEVKVLEEKIKEKQNLEKEKEKSALLLANKRESLQELKAQSLKIKNEIAQGKEISFSEDKIKQIQEKMIRFKEDERNLQTQLINFSSQIASLNSRKGEATLLKEKIKNLEKCPTCLQDVNQQYKENIFQKVDSEIVSSDEQTKKLNEQKSQVFLSISNIQKQIDVLSREKSEEEIKKIKLENLKEKESSLLEIEKRQVQTEADLEMISKHLQSLEESIISFSSFTEIFEKKRGELETEKLSERNQEIKIAGISKEIEMTKQIIQEIEKQIEEKNELKKKLDYLKELKDWLSEKFLELVLFTEKNIMLKLKDEFSRLFSEWFSILVSETLSVRLDEEFSPIIEQQGFEIAYNHLSGGERTAVALAYRLALNQVINSLLSRIKTRDLIILDEPTDGFSETQLDKIRDVLSQLSVAQLILVSHETKIEGFVDNILKLKKENGITQIGEMES